MVYFQHQYFYVKCIYKKKLYLGAFPAFEILL